MKIKQMRRALLDLAEEGIASVLRPLVGSNWIVGVVGALQLEVIAARSEVEYGLPIGFEPSPYDAARCFDCPDDAMRTRFIVAQRPHLAEDEDDALAFLARSDSDLQRVIKNWPDILFLAFRVGHAEGAA